MATPSDDPEPSEPAASDIEDLRSVLAGLEEEMETLESSLSDLKESDKSESDLDEVDEVDDLEDPENRTRMSHHRMLPREAPEPLYEELGEEEVDAIPDLAVVFDLNPKPNADKVRPRKEAGPEKHSPKAKMEPHISKREKKRLAREEKAAARAAEREAKPKAKTAVLPGDSRDVESEDLSRSMDDLDLENPLPEATFAPDRDHADLVMDRRQRRLEASAIAQLRERDQDEVWDQSEEEGEIEKERPFNLPVYLAQAVLVSLAGILIIMGVRTAYKSMREAEVGEEEQLQEATPSLRALGLIEATEVVKAYLAAPNWEKKLEYVRQPESARPRMKRYYEGRPGEDASVTGVELLGQNYNSVEGGNGFLFKCRLANGDILAVPAVRILSEAPFYTVDWETLVDYADVGWSDFLEARRPGSRGIFRLYGAENDFYAFRFSDSSKYLCLQLYDREREVSAHGYVLKESEVHSDVQTILKLWARKRATQQPASQVAIQSMLLAESDDPQRLLKAMIALQNLEDPDETADDADLFKDKNFIRPELWTRQKEFWAPMTLEVGFPENLKRSETVVQLEILRFLSPNWIVGESLIKSEVE